VARTRKCLAAPLHSSAESHPSSWVHYETKRGKRKEEKGKRKGKDQAGKKSSTSTEYNYVSLRRSAVPTAYWPEYVDKQNLAKGLREVGSGDGACTEVTPKREKPLCAVAHTLFGGPTVPDFQTPKTSQRDRATALLGRVSVRASRTCRWSPAGPVPNFQAEAVRFVTMYRVVVRSTP
jgi:hypothetical protein